VCTVNAVGTVTLVSAGNCTLTADAAVTPGYQDSGLATFGLTINLAPTTATVTSSLNPSTVGQQVTYTAAVTANSPSTGIPTGNVEFLDGGSAISGCTAQALSGTSTDTATCTTAYSASGNQTITVEYLGSTNFAESAVSAPITQTVNSESYSGGSGTQSLPSSPGDYYYVNQDVPGNASTTGRVNEFAPGTPTTLTGLSVTLSNSSGSSQSVTVYLIAGTTSTPTALTCSVPINTTTCSITTSVSVPAGDSINVRGTGNGSRTAIWTVTYTQP
jgi:hypothetical protein